ncbi:MAG: hypothetical protein IKV96_03380, partial [Firmicutes bacterium]|nr:hypothetical protein [Bacillota bacterium]
MSGSKTAGGAVTGSGTENDPFNDLNTALNAVKDGGTIQVLNTLELTRPSDGDPAINITKAVTITGGTFSTDYAGIVLGADVTLKDVTITFNNPVRNVIIANGHALTLENVQQSGTYEIDLFCGAITEAQNTYPQAGNDGRIIIKGTNNKLGDIYAGNFSDLGAESGETNKTVPSKFNGDATVTIENGTKGTIGRVYAYGARENRQGGGPNDMWTGNGVEENFTVNGQVKINLHGSFVKNVYGTSDKKACVTFESEAYICNINFENIGTLEVKGILEPASLNQDVNIKINENAELVLSTVIADDTTFTVKDFTGGGMLVMGKRDKLVITGTVSGETEFQTDTTVRPSDKSTSGLVELSWPYVDVSKASGNGTFTFKPYEATQEGTTLTLVSGVWTTLKKSDSGIEGLTSFTLADGLTSAAGSVTVEEINESGFSIPVTYVCSNNSVWLSDITMNIVITKDSGTPYTATELYDDQYGYSYKLETLGMNNIFATEDADGNKIITISGSGIASGAYHIAVTVPLVGQAAPTAKIEYTLTVTGQGEPSNPDDSNTGTGESGGNEGSGDTDTGADGDNNSGTDTGSGGNEGDAAGGAVGGGGAITGGGGGAAPLPAAPEEPASDLITNTAGTTTSAPTTSVDMSQSTTSKGGETSTIVDQNMADKIVENAVANKSEEVVIDATVKNDAASQSTKEAAVELPTETIAQIAEKTEADVTIKTDVAEIKMDTQAL